MIEDFTSVRASALTPTCRQRHVMSLAHGESLGMPDAPNFLLKLTNTGEWILLQQERDQDLELEAMTIATFEFEVEDHEGVVHLEPAPANDSSKPGSTGFSGRWWNSTLRISSRAAITASGAMSMPSVRM